MDTFLSSLNPNTLTITSVVLLIILLICFGLLVPRRTVTDIRKDRDARVKELSDERDEWKAAYFASNKTAQESVAQAKDQLEIGRATLQAINAIPPLKKPEISHE